MTRPRHLGSSPSLNRSLSRLSSSSSFSSRQSNSRIYTFLVAGGLLLFATVTLLQVLLLRAPQSSKLSPLENGKSDEGVAAEQSWWKENAWVGNAGDLDPATGKRKAFEKGKLGRKMGEVHGVVDGEEGESSDEDMEAGDEDEDADQDLFDIDIDDRVLDEETEELEDMDLGILAEMSNEEDSAENITNEIASLEKSGQEVVDSKVSVEKRGVGRVASLKSRGISLVNNEKGGSIPSEQDMKKSGRHESKQDDRKGKANAIPDWVLDNKLGIRHGVVADALQNGFERDLVKDLEKRKGSFFWDHALGHRKRSLENVEPVSAGVTKGFAAVVKPGGNKGIKHVVKGDEDAAKVAVKELLGFKEVVENWKERFNSDDELIDDNVQQRLEGVREIEDALLLNGDGSPDKPTPAKKFGGYLKKGRGAFDATNPANNPMLQDPDTTPGTWMTKTDKEMLRAIRGDRSSSGQPPKALLRGNNPSVVTVSKRISAVGASSDGKQEKGENTKVPLSEISVLDGSGRINGVGEEGKSLPWTSQSKGDEKKWGCYPGIGCSLSFSEYMEAFLGQENCTMNVFMAWTTPAWGFTARHQRVLESLFRFHRNACVVVFSETFELDFFKSFVKEGYKVTVVRPNLQEVLAGTPSEIFAAILPKWKTTTLFHLHYTELLRLAALYKYGGIYLDMDMLVLKPLDSLRNTVGSEITASGELRLNGAILVFDKSSLFLKKCMEEFTRTYDETLVQYNGADLLTRVANSTVDENGGAWTQFPGLLKVTGPFSFFPLDSSGISKFFAAPKDDNQKQQHGKLLTRISVEAYTIHLWNSVTSNLVPEINSLVGTILSRSCLRCKGIL